MIGEFFAMLFGGGYVAGKMAKGVWSRATWQSYDDAMGFNKKRQQEVELMCFGTQEQLAEIEKRVGFCIDLGGKNPQLGAEEAVRVIARQEGWTYFDRDEQRHTQAYRRANGYKDWRKKEIGHDRYWETHYRRLESARWRDEHPHGREVPISPYNYINKSTYLADVDRYWNKQKALWQKNYMAYLLKENLDFLFHRIDPKQYDTLDEFMSAARELAAKYEKYPSFHTLVLDGPAMNTINDIEKFWHEMRPSLESDMEWACDVYNSYVSQDSIWNKERIVLFKDKCHMLGLSYPEVVMEAKLKAERDFKIKYEFYSYYKRAKDKEKAVKVVDEFEKLWDKSMSDCSGEDNQAELCAAMVYYQIYHGDQKVIPFRKMLREKCASLNIDLDKVAKEIVEPKFGPAE